MKHIVLKVEGMSCNQCAKVISKSLEKLQGINEFKIDLKKNKIYLSFDKDKINKGLIIKAVEDAGYTVLL